MAFIFFFQVMQDFQNVYHVHILTLIQCTFLFILVPKYHISQDPNLKFYVSVYHHQPPPVLPWQLPENVDPDVKLIIAKHKNE